MEDQPRMEPATGEATPAAGDAANGQREVRLRINEQKMTTGYANGFRSSLTRDEVVVDFGLNLPQPTPGGGEDKATHLTFEVQHRAVMNYATAKRLAMMLSNAVRQYEQRAGEIKVGQ